METFDELNLDTRLLEAVHAAGFTKPTDIQREAIPLVLQGGDVMGSAQTGTGKTAAFVLPTLERLFKPSEKPGKGPRVLILAPTRELALQVNADIEKFSRFCKVNAGSVLGGMPYPPQIKLLEKEVDLLVATPGRLMDHMQSGRIDFSRLEVLILDEADRMLDMGFINAVRKITAATPKTRQTLLFSATLEGAVMDVAKAIMKDPAKVSLAANKESHALIAQTVLRADNGAHKQRLLTHYIKAEKVTQAVIFTATKRGADDLARRLEGEGLECAVLHGDLKQSARKRTIEGMKKGEIQLLVATDVAARGLDIKGLSHVVNYDLPSVAEDYIHRIGRTGRAGETGSAVSLVNTADWTKLVEIEKLTGKKLERQVIPGMEPITPEPKSIVQKMSGKSWRPTGMRRRRRGKF